SHHPVFIFLSETKKPNAFVKTICKKLGFEDRFSLVDPQGQGGGLLLLWEPSVSILHIQSTSFYIAIHFQLANSEPQWGIFVYLSTNKSVRISQWADLEAAKTGWGDLWFVSGDWNDLCSNVEKEGGNPRPYGSFLGFNSFIKNMDMEEIKMLGHQFTWCNNRTTEGLVEERLDRAFGSLDWHQAFPNATVLNKATSSSDHSILLVDAGSQKDRKPKRFHFDKRWVGKEGFLEVVSAAWRIPVSGTPFFKLKEKVKNTRTALLIWSSKFHTQNQLIIASLTQKLEDLRAQNIANNWDDWNNTRIDLQKAHHQEELYWNQKVRLNWLKHGDSNSNFFHAYTLQRRRKNAISRLVSSRGEELTSQSAIQSHISDFYSNLFCSEGSWGGDSVLHLIPRSITSDMNTSLMLPVEEEEVKTALFSLPPDKSPGEEGMSAFFYQHL
ncbi:Unknown protein, partial [Striga hermonthica]